MQPRQKNMNDPQRARERTLRRTPGVQRDAVAYDIAPAPVGTYEVRDLFLLAQPQGPDRYGVSFSHGQLPMADSIYGMWIPFCRDPPAGEACLLCVFCPAHTFRHLRALKA